MQFTKHTSNFNPVKIKINIALLKLITAKRTYSAWDTYYDIKMVLVYIVLNT